MAFLGAFFLAWAVPPPNQLRPQPDILSSESNGRKRAVDAGGMLMGGGGSKAVDAYREMVVIQVTGSRGGVGLEMVDNSGVDERKRPDR